VPTIVLVGESADWSGVIGPLVAVGHRVIDAGLAVDAELLRAIDDVIVLVGHGPVITQLDTGANVRGLVHVGQTSWFRVGGAQRVVENATPRAIAELILEAAAVCAIG
jgi:hypothetical protein